MIRFWFPSSTNEQLFVQACERRGIACEVDYRLDMVRVEITADVMILAEQFGGIER
jgi:hypothetical protein